VKPPEPEPVTELLLDWGRGDESARERLLPLIYQELRRRAAACMRHESPGQTLQPTALVHEAYLRLIDQNRVAWKNRSQFFGVAAQMMRRILVDHARRRRALKRGSGLRVTLTDGLEVAGLPDTNLEALDTALDELARLDPRQSRVVELRYFGGLSIEETATAMELSPATVKREWTMARAWLYGQVRR
jgi:RNA polymerase sigma factor (TIGR02999 family)